MSPSELDPLTGAIAWPAALRDEEYNADRAKIEAMYQQRASAGFLTADRGEAQQTMGSLTSGLKKNLSNYVPQDYVQAKKFIEGLNYELFAPSS